jgi:hypothetical protein
MTFTQFLKDQEEKQRSQVEENKQLIEEWRSALQSLYNDIRKWLRESDSSGVIKVDEKESDITEEGIGHYKAPRLNLHIFGRWIGIIPKARKTIGTARPPQRGAPIRALGRVDLTDETRRYVLYRTRENGHDVWLIDDLRNEQRLLNKEIFEEALMSYFQ